MKITAKLWIGLVSLALLSPLGLLLPGYFRAGDAWGEWSVEGVKELVGYIPEKLEKLSSIWKAPLPDYAFQGVEEKGIGHLSAAYIFSAVIGIVVVVAIMFLIGKMLTRKVPSK